MQNERAFRLNGLTDWITASLAGLSILKVLQEAIFRWDLYGVSAQILDFWSSLIGGALEITGLLFIANALVYIINLVPYINIKLHSSWELIFSLLLFIAVPLSVRTWREGNKKFATVAMLKAGLLAFISAFIAGSIPYNNSLIGYIFMACIPVIAFWITLYWVWIEKGGAPGDTALSFPIRYGISITGVIFIVVILSEFDINDYVNPSLIAIVSFVFGVSIARMIKGWQTSSNFSEFLENPVTIRSWYIMRCFVAASTIAVIGEGQRLMSL